MEPITPPPQKKKCPVEIISMKREAISELKFITRLKKNQKLAPDRENSLLIS